MEWGAIALLVVIVVAMGLFVRQMQARNRRKALQSLKERIGSSREALLSGSNTASLPLLDASDFGYRPVFQEKLIAVQDDVTQMEFRGTGHQRTGGASVSIPMGKEVLYTVSSGSIRSQKDWHPLASGRLLITDKAIVFEGDAGNERITWGKVAEIETRPDGYEVSTRGDPPRTYRVSRLDLKFAAILELILIRTG